jgi:hypothetical protein
MFPLPDKSCFEHCTSFGILSVFNLAKDCLKNSTWSFRLRKVRLLNYEAREKHFKELKEKFSHFVTLPAPCLNGYCGPWIEQSWISTFFNSSYQSFGPFIPIFIPWYSLYYSQRVHRHFLWKTTKDIFRSFRPEFIYITISVCDFGLDHMVLWLSNFT